MSFANDLTRFVVKTRHVTQEVYNDFAGAVHASIKFGSPVTGAPGQPVDTSNLLNSWVLDVGPTVATISTNVAYAPVIEYNDRSQYDERGTTPDRTLPDGSTRRSIKSTVGGNHSVKLTIAGADRLLAQSVRELAR